ncbi:MAG TPA: hypothetical protein VGM53_19735 [Streptosporangiaceae bacterium]|jgi:hypothetical protein
MGDALAVDRPDARLKVARSVRSLFTVWFAVNMQVTMVTTDATSAARTSPGCWARPWRPGCTSA